MDNQWTDQPAAVRPGEELDTDRLAAYLRAHASGLSGPIVVEQFPGSKLYGPYSHGGRNYYQWMARGACLREQVLPILSRHVSEELDAHAAARLSQMVERYRL